WLPCDSTALRVRLRLQSGSFRAEEIEGSSIRSPKVKMSFFSSSSCTANPDEIQITEVILYGAKSGSASSLLIWRGTRPVAPGGVMRSDSSTRAGLATQRVTIERQANAAAVFMVWFCLTLSVRHDYGWPTKRRRRDWDSQSHCL